MSKAGVNAFPPLFSFFFLARACVASIASSAVAPGGSEPRTCNISAAVRVTLRLCDLRNSSRGNQPAQMERIPPQPVADRDVGHADGH
jgi:hypothetical protein